MSRMEIPLATYRDFWRSAFFRYLKRGGMTPAEARQRATETMRNAFYTREFVEQSELEKDLEDARLHISE